jgi:outer membrane protein assembly factor BamB
VFSSPCIADGRIYIGEGFHYNPDCKLYCVNAATGKKLGEFPTKSQVESSPTVVNGKVYFGAGNQGVYAADAFPDKSGAMKEIWHFQPRSEKIVRFGASPVVANGRVYIGSGVDRIYEEQQPGSCETALYCLDAETGQELWKVPVDLPCWAAPVVSGDVVFFTLGNGDLYFDATVPAGQVLCLDAKTGKEVWKHTVLAEPESPSNGVHTCPAVDAQSVYVGSRTGYCYCLDRFTGKQRWKKYVGSPVFASPVLDQGAQTGCAVNVFVLATGGRVSCLDAKTGQAHWAYNDLVQQDVFLGSTPAIVSVPTPAGIRRQIYFGMYFGAFQSPKKEPFLYVLEDVLTVPTINAAAPAQP